MCVCVFAHGSHVSQTCYRPTAAAPMLLSPATLASAWLSLPMAKRSPVVLSPPGASSPALSPGEAVAQQSAAVLHCTCSCSQVLPVMSPAYLAVFSQQETTK